MKPRLLVAGAHRYADLARLWHRSVARDVVPAFAAAGFDAAVTIFCDTRPESFEPDRFPGARLRAPAPGARDFVEFYDAALDESAEFLLILDADVFLPHGAWAAAWAGRFADPNLAAVSCVRRTQQPGLYALLVRTSAYRALPRPVFAPSYEGLDRWPASINRQPGDRAALAIRERGLAILDVPASESAAHVADFHGTTVIRASRELFGAALGQRFEELIAEKPYFAMGAYDNLLLGTLYRALFGEGFAVGSDGAHLSASATAEVLRHALAHVTHRTALARFVSYADRSRRALALLAAREGIPLAPPPVLPRRREAGARAWGALRRLAGRSA